jgi:glycosyltransferase involved in cell wall biosynthesis
MADEHPCTATISIIIPTLNEESHIRICLNSVLEAEYPDDASVEIIIVDGGSIDRTTSIVLDYEKRFDCIKLIKTSSANCPTSMNIGIAASQGQYIAKVDAHGSVNKDYFQVAIALFQKYPTAGCVGGPITPLYTTSIGQANRWARHSYIGVGGGANTLPQHEGQVSSVQCGVYRLDVLKKVGFFDPALQFGEDEELNFRIMRNGYQIINTPKMTFSYQTRNTFKALFKQYFNYGKARFLVIKKHPSFFRIKHIVPSIFSSFLFAIPLLFFSKILMFFIIFMLIIYLSILLIESIRIALKQKYLRLLFYIPVSFLSLHLGYGIGFIAQLFTICARVFMVPYKRNR